jgi:hypothetical protein
MSTYETTCKRREVANRAADARDILQAVLGPCRQLDVHAGIYLEIAIRACQGAIKSLETEKR